VAAIDRGVHFDGRRRRPRDARSRRSRPSRRRRRATACRREALTEVAPRPASSSGAPPAGSPMSRHCQHGRANPLPRLAAAIDGAFVVMIRQSRRLGRAAWDRDDPRQSPIRIKAWAGRGRSACPWRTWRPRNESVVRARVQLEGAQKLWLTDRW